MVSFFRFLFVLGLAVALGCGSSTSGDTTPKDQCIGDEDRAAYDALATDDLSGPAVAGMIAAGCPTNPTAGCGTEVGNIVTGDTSERARNALGDCIARCIADETGLSEGCTGCYGAIASCSTAFCIEPCLQDAGSEACSTCAFENCSDFDACTGL